MRRIVHRYVKTSRSEYEDFVNAACAPSDRRVFAAPLKRGSQPPIRARAVSDTTAPKGLAVGSGTNA